MNMINKLKVSTLFLAMAVVVSSCADLSVENVNDPDRERALANPSDLVSLLQGSSSDVFFEITNLWGVHMDGLSDQMTSTNRFLSFWDFADEPRLRINNRTTYADAVILNSPWSTYNAGVSTANSIIGKIEGDGDSIVLDNGTDVTQKMLAAAYFLRGVSRGYISMIYDQGYIVDYDTDLSALELVPYSDIAEAAITDLDQAKTVASGVGSGFVWDFLPTSDTWDLAQFQTIVNSMAARVLASVPRTLAEANSHDWSRVLSYADAAVGGPDAPDAGMTDFSATSVGPYQFYNNLQDWSGFVLSDGAGYLPTDLKVLHMLDPNYPVNYPDAPTVLDPAQSNDQRIDYFNYDEDFGFLNPARRRSIFSNYWNLRTWCQNNCGRDGFAIVYYLAAETDYIRAEAYLRQNDKLTAATILNDSPFGNGVTELSIDLAANQLGVTNYNGLSGGNSISANDSDAAFQRALLREYSVELDLMAGMGAQWFFMRRWDMLQPGTALHYAVPGEELEITGREYYTFGGVEYANEEGTADGSNNWKNLSPKIQGKANTLQSVGTYEPRQLSIDKLGVIPFDFYAGEIPKGNN